MPVLTDTFENQIINHFLRNTTQTPAATLYVGLFTAAPAEDGTGGTEVTGGSYARQAITFTSPTTGATENSAQITFPTASANWGTVVGSGVFSAVTAGTLLFYAPLGAPQVVNSGAQFIIAAGSADFSLD